MNKRRRPAGLHEGRPALRASNACWPFLQVRGAGTKKATANSAARARKASSLFSFFFYGEAYRPPLPRPLVPAQRPVVGQEGHVSLGHSFTRGIECRLRVSPFAPSMTPNGACGPARARAAIQTLGRRPQRPHRIGVRAGPAGRAQSGSRTVREGRQAAARRPSPRPPPRRRGGAAPQWQEPAALVHGASAEGARSTRAGLLAPEEAPRASPPVRPGVGPTPGQGCAGAGACCRPRPAARGNTCGS